MGRALVILILGLLLMWWVSIMITKIEILLSIVLVILALTVSIIYKFKSDKAAKKTKPSKYKIGSEYHL